MMEMVMLYSKVIGNVMVLMSGTMLGIYCGRDIQKRYDELNLWKQNFMIIYADISYGGVTFLEVIQHIEEQAEESYQPFFQFLTKEITNCRKKRFGEIWSEGIDSYLVHSHLNQEDKEALKHIGHNIGNVDKEQQLSMLQLYLDKLEYTIQGVEREKDKKIKLYKTIGGLGSIFVVILFL